MKWKKALLIIANLVLGTYLVFAFTVFNKPDETMRVCTKANISIDDERTGGFIDVQEISKRLKQADMFPLGKQMQHINARNIEEMLKRSAFVKTAECYKTEDGQVFISISQLTPVVRVKAENGDDYYLDDKDCIMPNSAYTSDLVIATGNISRTFAVKYLSPLAKAIMANDLWHNMVEQINVLPNADIEIVPRIGDHIVCLGPLPEAATKEKRQQLINDFVNTKFTRLEKFYRYGLSQAGWNKYDYINIEFDNQIICKRHSDKRQPMPTPPIVAKSDSAAIKQAANTQASNVKPVSQKEITKKDETMKTENKAENKKADKKKAEKADKADKKKADKADKADKKADKKKADKKKADKADKKKK